MRILTVKMQNFNPLKCRRRSPPPSTPPSLLDFNYFNSFFSRLLRMFNFLNFYPPASSDLKTPPEIFNVSLANVISQRFAFLIPLSFGRCRFYFPAFWPPPYLPIDFSPLPLPPPPFPPPKTQCTQLCPLLMYIRFFCERFEVRVDKNVDVNEGILRANGFVWCRVRLALIGQ